MNNYPKLILPLLVLFSAIGCDLYPQDEFEKDYVIESYLVANRTLPQVRISTTVSIDQKYQFSDVAVNDADVEVRLLDERGESIEQRFLYVRQSAGVYITNNPHHVLPGREYELHVSISNSDTDIRATTIVPGDFSILNRDEIADSVAYQDPRQVTINTTRSQYPGRQTFFIFTLKALNPEADDLTPFYWDQVNEQDENIENFYSNSSNIVNEKNYEQNEDGTLTLRVPWVAVAFYKDNFIIANAIDDNMYDFKRSEDVQGGGSTLPPGEFQNVIYNVEGGIGVFGSLASDTVKVYFRRNQ